MGGQDTWMAVETYLGATFTAAKSTGGVLGVQPNPDGTTGIQLVSNVAPPQQAIFPNIGFMFLEYDEDIIAAGKHELISYYAITVSVRQPHDPTIADLGIAALANLKAYQDDGSGNGLSPLLRGDVTLGHMVQWSRIKHMERHVLQSDADAGDVIATAIYTLETHEAIAPT